MENKISTLSYGFCMLLIGSALHGSCTGTPERRAADPEDSSMMNHAHRDLVLTSVPFTIAEKYYVKHDKDSLKDPKVTNQADFQSAFGDATLMGVEGIATPIDFDEQFVIAVVLDETTFDTRIEPIDLKQTADGELALSYTIVVGEKSQARNRPSLLLIVDQKFSYPVELHEVR